MAGLKTRLCGSSSRYAGLAFLAMGILVFGPTSSAWSQAGDAWTTPSGTVQGTRFSALDGITASNVGSLVEEFSLHTGVKESHEGQPLVVGSTMYVVTPFPNDLIAIDLNNPGRRLWTFSPATSPFAQGKACCDVVNRGPAYADGMIIYSALDNTVLAVNATTGALVWSTSLGDPHTGQVMTGAPLVVGNLVIVGNSGGEFGVRGWVQALSVKTGARAWMAYNTGSDTDVKIGPGFHAFYPKDRGSNLGSTSWGGTLWRQGGGTSWGYLTYDPELKLLFHGTSNPGVWNPDMRPGENKWSATIFARDPTTGDAVWAYQLTPHDGYDFDAISESIAVDLPFGGTTRQLLMHFDKNGFAYTLDRTSGEVLKANPYSHVTWSSGIDLNTGIPAVNPGFTPHQGAITQNICPTPEGAKEFVPSAYSPRTELFYVPTINFCDSLQPLKAMYIAGTPFLGAALSFTPGPGGNLGALIAWNPKTGTRAWSVPETFPVYSGVLATAGNLVFYGTLDGHFKALNATTGALLFQAELECGIGGNPISFTAPDGKQRIAVYTGVGWLAGGLGTGACPAAKPAPGAPTSGAVHVFKLP